MTVGISALGKTLIGQETTNGGSTDAPTTHWRGMGVIKDTSRVVFPPEKVGKLGGTSRSYIPETGSEVPLDGDAIYEQLPYIFDAAFYKTTPVASTDGSQQVRTWTVQAASSDPIASSDLGTLVVQTGDNIDVEIARYVFVREFTLAGAQGEAMSVSAVGQGQQPSTSAFAAVGDTDLQNAAESVLFSKVGLYIDPSTDAAGTTQVSETILDMSLKVTTGWVALPAKDGRLDFSNLKHVDDEILLDVTFEHNASSVTAKANWRAQTEKALRLQWTGSALTSTDTYDTKTQIVDLWGKWDTFGADGLGDQDGDNIYKGTFRARWCAASGLKARFINVTEVATLP